MNLQKILSHVNGDEACAAAHAGEIIALDITSHGEFVYENGRE